MSCFGCVYYDNSVDCCNADDLCPMEEFDKGYKIGYNEAIRNILKVIKPVVEAQNEKDILNELGEHNDKE